MSEPTESDPKTGGAGGLPPDSAAPADRTVPATGAEQAASPAGKSHGVRVPRSEGAPGVSERADSPPAVSPPSRAGRPAGDPAAVPPTDGAPAAAAKPAAPAPAKHAPARAAEGGKAAPGYAAQLAKGTAAEQEPLVGSESFGWRVLEISMTVGLIALAVITAVSCWRMMRALLSVL